MNMKRLEGRHGNGSVVPIDVTLRISRNPDGITEGIVGVARDSGENRC